MNKIFNIDNVEIKPVSYVIGISELSYCLGRKIDGEFEILLCKTIGDKDLFKEEVDNLSKYFNAFIYK